MTKTLQVYYADDNATEYALYIPTGWIGYPTHCWGAGGPSGPIVPFPAGLKMRCVTCKNAAGRHRNYPISSIGTWRSITIGQVFSMPTNSGTFQNWTVIGKKAGSFQPKRYRKHRPRP